MGHHKHKHHHFHRKKINVNLKKLMLIAGIGFLIYSGIIIYSSLGEMIRYVDAVSGVGFFFYAMLEKWITWLGVGLIITSRFVRR
jgi:hypothetical protein